MATIKIAEWYEMVIAGACFAQRIADYCDFRHKVTGARLVRFTNGGGYPVYRLDMTHGGTGTNRPRPISRRVSIFEIEVIE